MGYPFLHRFLPHFWSPREGKKLCFLCKGCQKSMFGLSRKNSKHDSQNDSVLVPFWHNLADFWGTRKSIKKWYPKSVAHGAKRVSKWGHFRRQIEGKFEEKSSTLFLTLLGTLLGIILTSFWYLFYLILVPLLA